MFSHGGHMLEVVSVSISCMLLSSAVKGDQKVFYKI